MTQKFTASFLLITAVASCAQPTATLPQNQAELQTRLSNDEKQLNDWPDLAHYREENVRLMAAPFIDGRVVFMGDSITDFWGRTRGVFFPGKPYVNRGISGQTTPQMLIRFEPDVIALRPKLVVILAGTNDLAGNTGPESLTDIENNLTAMVQLAAANKIHVILSSVMPVCDYIKPQTTRRPPSQIIALNDWIRQYATSNHLVYLDYYNSMLDDHQMLRQDLTYDGLHPNDAGYEVMSKLASAAIARSMAN